MREYESRSTGHQAPVETVRTRVAEWNNGGNGNVSGDPESNRNLDETVPGSERPGSRDIVGEPY